MDHAITQIEEIFSSNGLLSQKIKDYLPRSVQIKMASAIVEALDHPQVLIAEAGTGTGKTYAYLIPAFISNKKVIISTGTKNLQDQLFHRDIPLIRRTLGIPLKIALLKGRSNYLCLHRVHTFLQTDFISSDLQKKLLAVKEWAGHSDQGELDQLATPLDGRELPYVTSTGDNCLGQDCEFYEKCFLLKARRRAFEADLVIINHHLFFADSQLKEQGIAELLPRADAIIFDEAHQLHEIATNFLGESLSGRQLFYLGRDIQAELQVDAPDMTELKLVAEKMIIATKGLLKSIGTQTRGTWEHLCHKPQLKTAIANLQEILGQLLTQMEVAALRGGGLESCWRRTEELNQRFKKLTQSSPSGQIHWYEVDENNFTIHHTPITVSGYFQALIESGRNSWVFTSATLSVGGDFSHFQSHLGLPNARQLYFESPFDYEKQAVLYLPQIGLQPKDNNYIEAVVQEIVPVLKITKGRAFILFTSHKSLQEAAALLESRIEYPLFIQGSAPKRQLLQQFCDNENSILLGTSSFWEGVDVKGPQLSCVIIDKIPFLAPDDPILKARLDHFKKQGIDPFVEYQLPQAVITLRQGVGRLIRDSNDKGILVLCDPRLRTKDYGRVFLEALPPMQTTHSLKEINRFFQGSYA